jgi:hypothetical protein
VARKQPKKLTARETADQLLAEAPQQSNWLIRVHSDRTTVDYYRRTEAEAREFAEHMTHVGFWGTTGNPPKAAYFPPSRIVMTEIQELP